MYLLQSYRVWSSQSRVGHICWNKHTMVRAPGYINKTKCSTCHELLLCFRTIRKWFNMMQVGTRQRRQGHCWNHVWDMPVLRSIKVSPLKWCGYRSSFLPSSCLIYSPHWLCHCLSAGNSGQALPSMRASWWSAIVLNVSLLLLWHFLLTLFAVYKTSVQAQVGCAPWHSSRIWFVP